MIVFGAQHMFAMFGATILVPTLTGLSVSATLLFAGIGTLIFHFFAKGKVPAFLGSSFAFIAGYSAIAPNGEAELLPYACLGVACAAMLYPIMSFAFKAFGAGRVIRFFPPVVTGSVITIIGLSLLPVAVNWITGPNPQAADYCSPSNIALSLAVLAIILFIYRTCKGFLGHISVLLGLVIGTGMAAVFGMVDFHAVSEAAMLGITTPFAFGMPVFEPVSCLIMTLVMLVTMAETTGDVMAVSSIVKKPMTEKMLTKALRADGFSTALGGVFNTFPYTAFAQNIGLISMTGIRSRYIVATSGVLLMILGLFPKLAAVVACIPTMVLGGAGLAMFGMVASSGIQALSQADLQKKGNSMVVAISVAVALIPIGVPSFYSHFPQWVQLIGNSGITIGSIMAIVLNVLLCDNKQQKAAEDAQVSLGLQ
jgi:NCS2 family nucleobase:cation symporter-2